MRLICVLSSVVLRTQLTTDLEGGQCYFSSERTLENGGTIGNSFPPLHLGSTTQGYHRHEAAQDEDRHTVGLHFPLSLFLPKRREKKNKKSKDQVLTLCVKKIIHQKKRKTLRTKNNSLVQNNY